MRASLGAVAGVAALAAVLSNGAALGGEVAVGHAEGEPAPALPARKALNSADKTLVDAIAGIERQVAAAERK